MSYLKNVKHYALLLISLLVVIACGKSSLVENQSSQLKFSAFYNERKITCDASFEHAQTRWQLNTIAFFVSNLQVQTVDMTWHSIKYKESAWQNKQTSLIWFATNCNKNTQYNSEASLIISPTLLSQTQKIRFTVGVPFAVNHLNPLTQNPPLNNPEMFWSWRNGHKFLRIDASSVEPSIKGETWSFHLGSIDCISDSSLRAPKRECAMPNRVNVELNWQAGETIALDLKTLLNNITLQSELSCMFNMNQIENCQVLLDNLQSKNVFEAKAELGPIVSEI